ncbi:DUF1501 domain-containing protein [Urbifossiella limnaea]|uniref:DUF1501 domain-containing protein n=1 Tax=Urbifossiella limnaea TaxID=2528023 RepID=A0A517XSL7_9BACT|nr:DUF1501 domain-containing protein [Urbifossiella limnaea]QDU20483.1 hypothetical protein ETAA1_24350 [Urbifossiella limnaea]
MTLSRRQLLTAAAGVSVSGWLGRLAAADAKPRRSVVLLWMAGGPATIDLFDLKPGHDNGGPFRPVDTTAPGLRIGEHLPNLAYHGHRLAVLRGMSTREGDHGRGTYLMRTGVVPSAAGIQYPTVGSLLSKELGDPAGELPNFVSIAPQRFFSQEAYSPGFLGPQHAPLIVGDGQFGPNVPDIDAVLRVADLARPRTVAEDAAATRLDLLRGVHDDFAATHPGGVTRAHAAAYDRAVRLMRSAGGKVFDLTEEKANVRDAYGRNLFGQGCLLARRLVERGVPFVEVTLGGWDTHSNNFDQVRALCGTLDRAWAQLMTELTERGLIDRTTVVFAGEFGRTPKINQQRGRDHFSTAWSTVVAGGGVKGGQAVGRTSADGVTVTDRPVSAADFLATLCRIVGVDPEKPNMSNVGRPIPIADRGANPVTEVVA